jgi:hypothetical protein
MRQFAGPQLAPSGYWLRFYPDYSAEPGLWLMDERGQEQGLEDFEYDLPSDLHKRIARWNNEWERFHDCSVPDGTRGAWVAEGYALLAEIRSHLEPLGWRIEPAFNDRRSHSENK